MKHYQNQYKIDILDIIEIDVLYRVLYLWNIFKGFYKGIQKETIGMNLLNYKQWKYALDGMENRKE